MSKKVVNASPKAKKVDHIANEAARIWGVTPRHSQYVRDGLRNNEDIFETIMFLNEGWNLLVKAAKEAVEFKKLYP